MYATLFLLAVLTTSSGLPVDEDDLCGTETIRCTCGTGENSRGLFLELQMRMIRNPQTGLKDCSPISDLYEACANHSCSFTHNGQMSLINLESKVEHNYREALNFLNFTDPGAVDYPEAVGLDYATDIDIVNSTVPSRDIANLEALLGNPLLALLAQPLKSPFRDSFDYYEELRGLATPRSIDYGGIILPSAGIRKGRRFPRKTAQCDVTTLKHAENNCWNATLWTVCEISCDYGYVLHHARYVFPVKKTIIYCGFHAEVWKPHGFVDCQPEVDRK